MAAFDNLTPSQIAALGPVINPSYDGKNMAGLDTVSAGDKKRIVKGQTMNDINTNGGWVVIPDVGDGSNSNEFDGHGGTPRTGIYSGGEDHVLWSQGGKYYTGSDMSKEVPLGTHKEDDMRGPEDRDTGDRQRSGNLVDVANTVMPLWDYAAGAWGGTLDDMERILGPDALTMKNGNDFFELQNDYLGKVGGVEGMKTNKPWMDKISGALPGALIGATFGGIGLNGAGLDFGALGSGVNAATSVATNAAGGLSSGNIAGLTQMAADAGLTGPAAQAFVNAGGMSSLSSLAGMAGAPEWLTKAVTSGGSLVNQASTPLSQLLKNVANTGSSLSSILNAAGPLIGSVLAGNSDTGTNDGANTANDIAKQQWQYYLENYAPLEKKLIANANNAGSPEEYARAGGEANADVTGAFNQAGKQAESRLQSFGLNPASPRYQDTMGSMDLAQGAASAGAQTSARNRVTDQAYSKLLDVTGLGRNIPAQSAASAANASNAAINAAKFNSSENAANATNIGKAITGVAQPLLGAAKSWYDNSNLTSNYGIDNVFTPNGGGYVPDTITNYDEFADGGKVDAMDPRQQEAYRRATGDDINAQGSTSRTGQPANGQVSRTQGERSALEAEKQRKLQEYLKAHPENRRQMGFADGGVIEATKIGHNRYDAGLDGVLKKRGINPEMRSRVVTPHMRHFAVGGGVGRDGLGDDESNMGMPNDVSSTSQPIDGQGTETSDSIPAEIDGQQPAALSDGEFVVNAAAVDLTGEEILKAINDAGLKKRQGAGLDSAQPPMPPQTSNDVSINAGMQAYQRGGRVQHSHMGL